MHRARWCGSFSGRRSIPPDLPLPDFLSAGFRPEQPKQNLGCRLDVLPDVPAAGSGISALEGLQRQAVLHIGINVVPRAVQQVEIGADLEPETLDDAEEGLGTGGGVDGEMEIVISLDIGPGVAGGGGFAHCRDEAGKLGQVAGADAGRRPLGGGAL